MEPHAIEKFRHLRSRLLSFVDKLQFFRRSPIVTRLALASIQIISNYLLQQYLFECHIHDTMNMS